MLLALDTDNDAHRGASQESIGLLPVTTIAVCISPIHVFCCTVGWITFHLVFFEDFL
jgi:hypothetical protein